VCPRRDERAMLASHITKSHLHRGGALQNKKKVGLRAAEDPHTQIKKYHPPSTTKEGWRFTYKVDIVLEESDFSIEQ